MTDAGFDFSVVVPTHDRPAELARFLTSIRALDYPRDRFEVIVVADGRPCEIDADTFRRDRINLRTLCQDSAGPAKARNTGLNAAEGRFVAFTDDDCVLSADWLSCLHRHFQCKPDSAIAGRVENGSPESLYSSSSQLLVDYLCEYFNSKRRGKGFGTSNNLAFPRRKLVDIAGFDESFTLPAAEDRELIDRWTRSNESLVYAPDVKVIHFNRMSFRNYSRQHINYGRGAYNYHRVRASRGAGRFEPEPWYFYSGMLKYPFKHESDVFRAAQMCGLICWSQVLNAVGYFDQKFLARRSPLPKTLRSVQHERSRG